MSTLTRQQPTKTEELDLSFWGCAGQTEKPTQDGAGIIFTDCLNLAGSPSVHTEIS